MYDVIVVGARCAGSPTAMLLARKGYRVLMVDRDTFPSDTFRNHVLLYPALSKLKRWGLLDEVVASNCPPIRKFTQDMNDFPLSGNLQLPEGITGLYAPRRKVLDYILVRAAVAAGVELREGFSVQELLWEGDRVVGIRGRTQGGTVVKEYAPIVVGADGLHSVVARVVGAPVYDEQPKLTWIYYSYWDGVRTDGIEFYRFDDVAMLGFPTNDGLTCVATFGPVETFHAYRAELEPRFMSTLARKPHFAERVFAGRRAERYIGTADLPNFFRKPFGPGWALVGDAGYHRDPVTANGISDAFRDAELLSDALDLGFSGRAPLMQALSAYEQRRNEVARPLLRAACQAATFGPLPAEALGLRSALRGNQAQRDRYFAMVVGAVPASEFFAPHNMAAIMNPQPAAA